MRSKGRRKAALRALGVLALTMVGVPALSADPPARTVLTGVTVIDATGAKPIEGATVVIEGDRIASVTPEPYQGSEDGETRVLDFGGEAWVLPGLWNNHSHLGDLLPDPKGYLDDEPLARATIRAGRNAMDALKAGFTSLRMTGERDFMDVAWKEAFDAGVFVGPRIFPAGPPISHANDDDWLTVEVDGPDEMRAMVRSHVDSGAVLIKLIGDRLSRDEIAAAIEEAHALGVPVTVHSGGEVSHLAVQLGADGIEHGNDVSEATIALMAEKGVFLDPTIVCNLSADYIEERERLVREAGYEPTEDQAEGRIMVAFADERPQEHAELAREVLVKAYEAGVRIIPGSDSNPIDELGILEIEQLVFSGLPEMGAIQAATRNSAEMMGVLDELGTVESGKLADLLVLARSPLESISNLRSVLAVIKDGKLVDRSVDEGQTSFWKLYFVD